MFLFKTKMRWSTSGICSYLGRDVRERGTLEETGPVKQVWTNNMKTRMRKEKRTDTCSWRGHRMMEKHVRQEYKTTVGQTRFSETKRTVVSHHEQKDYRNKTVMTRKPLNQIKTWTGEEKPPSLMDWSTSSGQKQSFKHQQVRASDERILHLSVPQHIYSFWRRRRSKPEDYI